METLTLEYKLRTNETLPNHKLDQKSKFAIYLNNELLGVVASPAFDGARLLLQLGYSPDTLMNTRAKDSQHISWKPKTLSHWAKLTVKERDNSGLAVEPFTQFPGYGDSVGVKPSQVSAYPEVSTAALSYAPGNSEGVWL